MKKLTDYRPDPRNANRGTERGLGMLERSLRDLGAGRSIVVDRNGVVIAGNKTLERAVDLGFDAVEVATDGTKLVVVRRTDLDLETDPKARQLAYADNRVGQVDLDFDLEQIAADLESGIDLSAWWTPDELAALVPPGSVEGDADADPQIDLAGELRAKWGVERGDLWLVGNHRLLCGDATSAEDVARLLGSAVPVLMVTDPPYGVNYDPTWRWKSGVSKNARRMGKVPNDDVVDWSAVWRLFPGDVVYVFHADILEATIGATLERCGFRLRSQIIWAKDRVVLSRGDYHWQHEPIWYAVREGRPSRRTADRKQTTLWEIPTRDEPGRGHGTQKPLECMARPIRNHDVDSVYDPFIGTGTTMVAAQNLGRICYGMDIDPGYVAVALQRMSDAFPGIEIRKAE